MRAASVTLFAPVYRRPPVVAALPRAIVPDPLKPVPGLVVDAAAHQALAKARAENPDRNRQIVE